MRCSLKAGLTGARPECSLPEGQTWGSSPAELLPGKAPESRCARILCLGLGLLGQSSRLQRVSVLLGLCCGVGALGGGLGVFPVLRE